MDTQTKVKLIDLCEKHHMEFVVHGDRVIFVSSKKPNKKLQRTIRDIIPDYVPEFQEGARINTVNTLTNMLKEIGYYGTLKVNGHNLIISNDKLNISEEHPFWSGVHDLLLQDPFFESWEITLGTVTVTFDKKIAEVLKERKEQTTVISKNDIMDVKIMMGQCDTIEDLLKEMGCDL